MKLLRPVLMITATVLVGGALLTIPLRAQDPAPAPAEKKALEKDKAPTTFFEDRDKDRDGFLQPFEPTETMTTVGVRIKF